MKQREESAMSRMRRNLANYDRSRAARRLRPCYLVVPDPKDCCNHYDDCIARQARRMGNG